MSRGRPLGFVSMRALETLHAQPMTMRALADSMQASVPLVNSVLVSLQRSGRVETVGFAPTDGRRPVRIYGAVQVSTGTTPRWW